MILYCVAPGMGWPGVGPSDLECDRAVYTGLGRGCVLLGVTLGVHILLVDLH